MRGIGVCVCVCVGDRMHRSDDVRATPVSAHSFTRNSQHFGSRRTQRTEIHTGTRLTSERARTNFHTILGRNRDFGRRLSEIPIAAALFASLPWRSSMCVCLCMGVDMRFILSIDLLYRCLDQTH